MTANDSRITLPNGLEALKGAGDIHSDEQWNITEAGSLLLKLFIKNGKIIDVASDWGTEDKNHTDAVADFMVQTGYLPETDLDKITLPKMNANMKALGFVLTSKGELVSQYELRPGDEVDGPLFLREDAKVPEGVTIHGELVMEGRKTLEAKSLKVDGVVIAPDLERVHQDNTSNLGTKFEISQEKSEAILSKWQKAGLIDIAEERIPAVASKFVRSEKEASQLFKNYIEAKKTPFNPQLVRRSIDR